MASLPVSPLTEEEYLRLERAASYRSEFTGGKMYAMPGGSIRHSRLIARLQPHLENQLDGTTCRTFNSDARIRVPTSGEHYYPDISVVCGPTQTHEGSADTLTNPLLLVEVLSPSSIHYDRIVKFAQYRQIPSLRDYLIVHTKAVFVEHWSRQSDGNWNSHEYQGTEAYVALPNLNCSLSLAKIYQGVMDEPT